MTPSREHLHRLFDGLEGFVALGMGFGGYFEGDSYKFPDGQFSEMFWLWPEHEDHLLAKVVEHVEKADIYICPLLRRTRSRKRDERRSRQVRLGRHRQAGTVGMGMGASSGRRASSSVRGAGSIRTSRFPSPSLPTSSKNLNQRLAQGARGRLGLVVDEVPAARGTLNHKSRARGFESAPVDFLEVVTGERDWSIEELRELLPAGGANGLSPQTATRRRSRRLSPSTSLSTFSFVETKSLEIIRAAQSFWFVAACIDAGLSDEETMWLALEHKPTKAKFGNEKPEYDRRAKEIARSIRKVRPSGAALGTHPANPPEAGVEMRASP